MSLVSLFIKELVVQFPFSCSTSRWHAAIASPSDVPCRGLQFRSASLYSTSRLHTVIASPYEMPRRRVQFCPELLYSTSKLYTAIASPYHVPRRRLSLPPEDGLALYKLCLGRT